MRGLDPPKRGTKVNPAASRARPWSLLVTLALNACVSASGTGGSATREPPPKITADLPLDKAVSAAIDYGGDTLSEVKRALKRRHALTSAAPLVEARLHDGIGVLEPHQLLNAGHLYASLPVPIAVKTFRELLSSERPLARQLAWQLAAVKPSSALAQAIEVELTRALAEGDEDAVLVPQMANAVRANHLRSSYTLVRQGLMTKGDEEFALAMVALDPKRASNDFLLYLAQAPAEELRQLTLSSVNLYTCVTILHHLQRLPPDMGAPAFDRLFFYAVSRNTALADLAQGLLEGFVPVRTEPLAQMLAKHPAWVQIAYLENARRRMNPKLGLFLSELKKSTAENDVVSEINEIKL